jgi:hypothetical protein
MQASAMDVLLPKEEGAVTQFVPRCPAARRKPGKAHLVLLPMANAWRTEFVLVFYKKCCHFFCF